MSAADWVIVAVVAVLFVLAARYSWKHKGSCGGSCAGCSKNCANRRN